MSSGCAGANGDVLGLHTPPWRCLGRWFVSGGIHMDTRIQGFPSRILHWMISVIPLTASGFNVLVDQYILHIVSLCGVKPFRLMIFLLKNFSVERLFC